MKNTNNYIELYEPEKRKYFMRGIKLLIEGISYKMDEIGETDSTSSTEGYSLSVTATQILVY